MSLILVREKKRGQLEGTGSHPPPTTKNHPKGKKWFPEVRKKKLERSSRAMKRKFRCERTEMERSQWGEKG